MFSGNQNQFAAAATNARLEMLLEGHDAGNGTPLAPVVAAAMEIDRRRAPALDRDILTSSDEDLVTIANGVLVTLKHPKTQTKLPFGTVFETRELGEILIGGERWTLDAGRPGLHPVFTTRKDAHGPNLELLHRHITRLTRRLACRRLGLPQPVLICVNGERHRLQFLPCAEAGGVVLQCSANGTDAPRFCGALPEQIKEFAESIVMEMRSFWKRRKDIAQQGAEVRAIAEMCVAGKEATVDAIIIEMGFASDVEDLDFHVHYLALDAALRPGLLPDFIPAWQRAQVMRGHSFGSPWGISERYKELENLRSHGADGRITGLAAAVLASGKVDSELIRSKLAEAYEVAVEIPGSGTSMFVALYWVDGTIHAEVEKHGTLDWARDVLIIHGADVPEARLVTMNGRPLADLVELPLGGDMTVERVERIRDGLRLHIPENYLLVDLASGRTWECPSDLYWRSWA
ncbi:hypothetical protein [Erythrobacter tepidarius]|uniref:hypothetical protein n=1 Tax=Erythrobacter tepidarius TaxID=60454 RepID=UPI000A3A4CDE|nr:hypothetical protein [Erythrobacter tepidarius]